MCSAEVIDDESEVAEFLYDLDIVDKSLFHYTFDVWILLSDEHDFCFGVVYF